MSIAYFTQCPWYICGVRIDIDVDTETNQLLTGVSSALTHCAATLDRIDQELVEIKRVLMDTARNFRKALGSGAALHVADGADTMRDESAKD